MALAHLLHQVSTQTVNRTDGVRWSSTALVVDHGVRDGSGNEAVLVMKNLESMGVRAKVMRLSGLSKVTQNASNIEGDLRDMRYKILADEAVRQGIQYLFVGHHLDDQIETLLIRLVRDEKLNPLSFAGIAPETLVPCNQGVIGARCTAASLASVLDTHNLDNVPPGRRLRTKIVPTIDVAAGGGRVNGVKLIRPLLEYRKRDLLNFCKLHNIPFVTDQTNFDPTITTRNAIRYMRARYSLPAALSEANLAHVQKSVRDMRYSIINSAKQLARTSFVQFNDADRSVEITLPRISNLDTPGIRRALAYVIARMAEVVSPIDEANIPELLARDDLLLDDLKQQRTTTKLRVQITRLRLGRSARITYRLHRQRMDLSDRSAQTRRFVWKSLDSETSQAQVLETEWLHWDNRFWISLATTQSSLSESLSVRPFHDKQDADLVRLLRGNKDVLPASTREGVPVLCLNDTVVALPTYNIWLSEELTTRLKCKIRYTVPPRTSELLLSRSDRWVRDPLSAEIAASVQEILRSSLEQHNLSPAYT